MVTGNSESSTEVWAPVKNIVHAQRSIVRQAGLQVVSMCVLLELGVPLQVPLSGFLSHVVSLLLGVTGTPSNDLSCCPLQEHYLPQEASNLSKHIDERSWPRWS